MSGQGIDLRAGLRETYGQFWEAFCVPEKVKEIPVHTIPRKLKSASHHRRLPGRRGELLVARWCNVCFGKVGDASVASSPVPHEDGLTTEFGQVFCDKVGVRHGENLCLTCSGSCMFIGVERIR